MSILFTFITFSGFDRVSAHARPQCEALFGMTASSKPNGSRSFDQFTVHTFTTHRSYEELLLPFEFRAQGVIGVVPGLKVDDVISGRKSLLSLGEGYAGFVSGLIERARKLRGTEAIPNIHAADLRYFNPLQNPFPSYNLRLSTEELEARREQDKAINDRLAALVSAYPNNYHGATFQELNLVGPDGIRMQFDEIVSSNAVDFVLGRTDQNETKLIITNILKHLKPGGTARIDSIVTNPHLEILLNDLMTAGVIEDYSRPSASGNFPIWYQIRIVKK